ncbi:MAG: cell division protein ZapA [Terrisporobacter othiniensis]|uniref:Cell division protein ZapA n=1 Tax=Terrisporobacter hibernicus TaxID=2813371 RepID=A0AAX2ZA86_9FIRM|nr:MULTISPECIES: cell division protein ZapA [Terrisporobacter]MBN9648373.1 cell division protein ZapA [Terrisporobacter glycolicus]MDU4861911.1 cell division protein ZapA [Terrisporobacter othiniensis]MDU6995792.1 cell division protein ZapA [Terrisporobacter othiniensis]UEL46138.1 cell division protein ZapA [Terrisporobacter hibernicus]UPA30248.1 cell division protein ZapA [Terrisporobacter glycolicus]
MNKVVVRILGSEYNIVGKNPEQMKNVARYVDGEMNKVREGNPKLSSLTTTIVACLNIADELFDCCHENEELHNELKSLKEGMGKPSEEVQSEVDKISSELDQKELEVMEKDYRIEELDEQIKEKSEKIENLSKTTEEMKLELEKYMAEIKSLKEENEEAKQRAEAAESIASQWQNKTYDYQLKYAELENQLKNREGAL